MTRPGLKSSDQTTITFCARFAIAFVVSTLLGSAANADLRLPEDTTPKYRKQWAIVIGVNYNDREDARIEGLQTLTNAEADAIAFAKLLQEHYGYTEETVQLLIGKDATKRAIEGVFGKRFLRNPQKVDKDDSVIVFFAGHGDRESSNDRTKAFLYPHDVQTIDGLGIDDATCVKIDYLVSELELCAAKHRLIILDSCHSGEVFNFAKTRSSSRYSVDRELFKHPVVQAMAAARAFQEAEDAVRSGSRGDGVNGEVTSEHSPFTTAILEALNGGIQSPSFGASALFSRVPERVKELASTQRPQGGTLSGEGEFYFFRTSDFVAPSPNGVPNFVFQTLPGLHGKWWFDEVPWLIPSLRAEPEMQSLVPTTIVARKVLPSGETVPAEIPRDGLFQPQADDVYQTMRSTSKTFVQKWSSSQRLAFQRLLDLSAADLDEAAIARLLTTFDSLDDPHLRAVVHHKFNQADAESLYREAIAAYEKDLPKVAGTPQDRSGLYRLCLSDFGQFMLDTGFNDDAAGYFRLAREIGTGTELSPFLAVHSMVWESCARAKQGEWKAADELLVKAEDVAQRTLAPEHPLLAAIHDRAAWNAMNRWFLNDAVEHFETALDIRERNGANDMTTRIAIYHNRHGLAMAQRFQARFDEARKGYQQLRTDLMAEAYQTHSKQMGEVLYQRLVNTLERLGDSYLFGTPGLPFDACETYQEAIDRCAHMSPNLQYRTRAKLICKLATALALAGDAAYAKQTLEKAESGDFAMLVGNQEEEIDLFRNVALAVAQMTDEQSGETCSQLRRIIAERLQSAEPIERQQFEVLLFAGDLLLKTTTEESQQADADLVLSIVPDDFINETNLPYLRPYFDAGLTIKLQKTNPFTLRRLTRTVLKAKTGGRTGALPTDQTMIVFYLGERSGYAITSPRPGSMQRPEAIALDFGTQTLKTAQLPDKLATWLNDESPLLLHWHDSGVTPPLANADFPFELSANAKLAGE